ncbi:probable alpha-aspartyl dipeptidase [Maniola jurtina]|uniref:probable alpha-aspartyl dipeptidase n=1 Tax=Maniola jurtina TaxID=191418 RepID=UPI001E685F5A|nr:probable alpha-aspartyl dipeptidase [Maniola jurtina]
MWCSLRYVYLRFHLRCTLPSSLNNFHITVYKYYSIMKSHPQALLLSSSNCHGYSLLEFAKQEICSFLGKNNVTELVFVPYAQKNYDDYTKKIKNVITPWGFSVVGLHTYPDPADAINSAKAIFVGGGNTFLLLKTLYDNELVNLIRERVHTGNLVYIGSSAGTNVATKSIHTTNDMPIIYPPSFDAISIVPFNINPHYIDKVETDTHKGETRDQRIEEYMEMPHANPVLGLKEGCILHVDGDSLILKGVAGAVLFQVGDKKVEYPVGADVSFLLDCTKEAN